MAGQKGRELLLKYDSTGGGSFVTIAGMRDATITINNEPVDITNKDSAGVRQLLAGAGTNSISVSGSGVFTDDSTVLAVRAKAKSNSQDDYQLVIPGATGGGTFEGEFMIASFEEAGEHNNEVSFSITLESAGTITFS